MIKKILSIILIIAVLAGTGLGVYYCYTNLDINDTEETKEIDYYYVMYSADETEFENNISAKGTIELSEEQSYINDYSLYYSNWIDANVIVNKGDTVKNGTVLGTGRVNGVKKEVASNSYGKVVYIKENEEEQSVDISVLNYDSLYFTVYMTYAQSQSFNYNSKVYYVDSDGEKVNCKIDFIGYEIDEDGNVEFRIVPKKSMELTPGMEKTFYFVIKEIDSCLALPETAVVEDNGRYYTLIEIDGKNDVYEERDLEVGKLFSTVEGGVTWNYYEIKSGVSDGDIVYSRWIKTDDTEGLEELLEGGEIEDE